MSRNKRNKLFRSVLIYNLLLFTGIAYSQSIQVKITGIRSDRGVLLVSLFENQEQFKADQPVIIKKVSKEGVKDSTLIVILNNLKPSTYGIAVLDDENENGDMDYKFKRPTEGFGFSNYYHRGLFRPKFEEFSIDLKEIITKVEVVMRYIKETE